MRRNKESGHPYEEDRLAMVDQVIADGGQTLKLNVT